MAVELAIGYRNGAVEENAVVQEAASGLESVEKLIRLLSQSSQAPVGPELEMDCRAVADVAVNKFKRVISLLGRTRTGHARFRRAPLASPPANQTKEGSESATKVYCPRPIQQVPLAGSHPNPLHHLQSQHDQMMIVNRVVERKDSVSKTINFSYSPAISGGTSFMSSLTGDTDVKQPSSSSPAFHISHLSQVSSAGRPPLSTSSLKRKCSSSENAGSGRCSGSSGRCHCSKKRKLRLKRVVRVPAISSKMADIPPDDYSWRKYGQKPIKGSPYPRGYYKCSSVRGTARFKEKRENDELQNDKVSMVDSKGTEMEETMMHSKKRKRKVEASEPIDGFSVFKTAKSEVITEENDQMKNEASRGKKELYRQMERDALFRKKYNIHVSGNNIPSPLQNFAELNSRFGCKRYLLRNFGELGFKEPTPIQRQAIPVLLSGRECFACAPTGSGKTLAFVCPILMKLKHASKDGVRAVILCPTRELAAQTARECKKMAAGKKFYIKLMTKQLVKSADFSKLPCDILISTPFRVQFAIQKRKLDLSRVEYLVLDESDKLFELGLVEQVDSVVKACSNPSILRSLFSATLPDTVEELARTIMHDAVRIIIGRKNSASESIKQKLVFVGSEEGKLLGLRQSFAESLNPPVLIFVQKKERAKELYRELAFDDIRADVIHADLTPVQRENAVDNFRAGKTWVLIATDVIARGMDFKGVNCVINYDFPDSAAAYIHRIGRCGRAGRRGEAITLYTEADVPFLRNIANVMAASGCEVPDWIMSLPKHKWKKHRPQRESISTKPEDEKQ